MHPQRRTALVSVVAAIVLIGLKLGAGLAAHSLGLVSEALHSGTDLVAALLTLFAVGVAVRPADVSHQYGHGKAEHLAALGEAAILVLASFFIAWRALTHLVGGRESHVQATWYAFMVIGIVILVDLSRTIVLRRASQRYHSAALASNALHFASDLAGSVAVLFGLVLVHAGYTRADSAAALFVAVLVLLAAARLMQRNIDVLMDRAPADAEGAARVAIAGVDPPVSAGAVARAPGGAAPVHGRGDHRAARRGGKPGPCGGRRGGGRGQHRPAGERRRRSRRTKEDDAVIRDRAHAAALGVPSRSRGAQRVRARRAGTRRCRCT